jgi:AcrR family transcriptional regulator
VSDSLSYAFPVRTTERTGRARPLPPEERRAALVAATLPLVTRYGMKVTTRQIAEAAGVAEGTIFRVFPDKEALVQAAVAAVLDPLPLLAELGGVDTTLPLPERLVEVVRILQRRLTSVFNLLFALRMFGPPNNPGDKRITNERILAAVAAVLEPDQDQFRLPVVEVARLIRLLTFSATHPTISDGTPLTAEQIASVVLNGVRRDPASGELPC